MCGIIGFIGNSSKRSAFDLKNNLCHRGEDDNGIFQDTYLSFVHTRLSILDLSSQAHQPMSSSDGQYVIIYNGEIYNHKEIRKELESKYTFKSTSDTETLLYGFMEYGEKILDKLSGIFAFAVYHKPSGNLFLARDPFGVKPLYYYHKEQNFIFASELKVFSDVNIDKEINYTSLVNYLSLLYGPGEATPFSHIQKLPSGHWLRINVHTPEKITVQKYHNFSFNNRREQSSEKKWMKSLEDKLLHTVEKQMLSDVPVGFFLSGGLDSSSLAALARSIYPNRKIQCFTLGIQNDNREEGFRNDLPYARKVASHLNLELEEVTENKNLSDHFEELIWQLDEPIADPAALHTWNISAKAKEMGYKVLISGTGGDELFSGYRRHQATALERYYNIIPPFIWNGVSSLFGSLPGKNHFIRRMRKLFSSYHLDSNERLIALFYWLSEHQTKELFSNKIKQKIEDYHPSDYFRWLLSQIPSKTSSLNKILYLDLHTYSIDNNLLYTDRMSMAEGVEVRVPFLDKELIEFAASIPSDLKLKGFTTKYLLRKVMEKYLPEEIIKRPKTGFGSPVRKWVITDLEPKIKEYLSPDALETRGIFDPKAVWQLIEDNKKGKVDASYSIYALLAIEVWMRKYCD